MESLNPAAVRIACVVFALGVAASAGRASPTPTEHQLKAVFLFQLSQFVTWPTLPPAEPQTPFVIGVLGNDPFGPLLDDVVRGEKAAGRPIKVRRISTAAEAQSCQILFVAAGEEKDWLAPALAERPVLTVGESDLFSRQHGMIRFTVERSRVRILINLAPARRAGLTISSKLLRVADQVEGASE